MVMLQCCHQESIIKYSLFFFMNGARPENTKLVRLTAFILNMLSL